jgi:hypothetical protein
VGALKKWTKFVSPQKSKEKIEKKITVLGRGKEAMVWLETAIRKERRYVV